jgi:hypothetical protein
MAVSVQVRSGARFKACDVVSAMLRALLFSSGQQAYIYYASLNLMLFF